MWVWVWCSHAWGGNHWIAGGAVRGGKIHGAFPDDLTSLDTNRLNVGRGRFIPTTPWEGMWYPVAGWLGVEDSQLAEIFPNLANFEVGGAGNFSVKTQAQVFA